MHSNNNVLYIPVLIKLSYLPRKPRALIQLKCKEYEKYNEIIKNIVVRRLHDNNMILSVSFPEVSYVNLISLSIMLHPSPIQPK